MALVTKNEIINAVFTRQVSESRIPTDYLEVIESKYIFPVLGKDLYNAVIASPTTYSALLNYVKPVIYWFAKYLLLPELRYEVSDLGTNQLNINNSTPLSDEAFALVRNQALIIAEEKQRMLNRYLEDNYTLYPLYSRGLNVSETCDIVGGIVMKKMGKPNFYDREPND